MTSTILYISYDGMLEPLGESQVLSYLVKLAKQHHITLISYEKKHDRQQKDRYKAIQQKLKQANINWHPMKYHKTPSSIATAFDIIRGILIAAFFIKTQKIQVIHARSYVASVIALTVKKTLKTNFIFDMRGFWADERIDGNIWRKKSIQYRLAKWFEKQFLLNANSVVSLTQAGVIAMQKFPYLSGDKPDFHIITTCTNLEQFNYQCYPIFPKWPQKKGFTLGYVGSASLWNLFEQTLLCFKQLLEIIPNAQLHIYNRGEHSYIQQQLKKHEISPSSTSLKEANREQVAQAMTQMDAGIFFNKPVFSRTASAPTKLGEFLGCGIPCLSNSGIGDMTAILEENQVGIAISDFQPGTMRLGIQRLLTLCKEEDIQARCRATAYKHFSLDNGVKAYDAIYKQLTKT